MGPCWARIFGIHFAYPCAWVYANIWPFQNAYIRDLNGRIYGFKALTQRIWTGIRGRETRGYAVVILKRMANHIWEHHRHNNVTKNQSEWRNNFRTQSATSAIFKWRRLSSEIRNVNPIDLKFYFRLPKLRLLSRLWYWSCALRWKVRRIHGVVEEKKQNYRKWNKE